MNRANPANNRVDNQKAYVPSLPKYVQQNPVYQKFQTAQNAAKQQFHHESNDNSREDQLGHDDDEQDYDDNNEDQYQDEEEMNDQENDNYEDGEDRRDDEDDEENHGNQDFGDEEEGHQDDEEEEENPYQDEEPIIEEEGESDPEESARHHRKGKQSPKRQPQNDYVEKKQETPKQAIQIEEVIDLKKIKNSKLYQKFLKETNTAKANLDSVSTNNSKVSDFGTNKESSNYPSRQDSGKKPLQKYQEKEDDDVPYYKKIQKQKSNEQDPPPLKNNKSAFLVEEPKQRSPIKKSNTQEERYSNNVPRFERSSDPNNLSNPEIVAGTPVRLSARNSADDYKNWEQPQLEHGDSMINLNLNSSSNYVSVPNQNFGNFPNFGNMMPMMNPQMMPWMNMANFQTQSKNPMKPEMNMGMNDPFLLGAKLQEAHQTLQREFEINKMLEAKCHEYMGQLEKSAANFEEFKKRIFEQNTNHQEEISSLQDRIQKLTDQLAEKEKQEENYVEELSTLRRKLAIETSSKNRILGDFEDAQKRLDELNRMKKDREGNMDMKDEELQRLKKQIHSDKEEISYLKSVEERLTHTIKDLNSTNSDLQFKLNDISKVKDDKDQRINMMSIEIDSVKSQNQNITQQYRDVLSENESLKRELFSLKERSMDAENEVRTTKMSNEKLSKEVNQLRDALHRTEENLERERRQKAKLLQNSNYSQEDFPTRSDYGNKSTASDRNQPSYDNYSVQSREDTRSEPETVQPTKYDNYTSKYDNYQNKYEKPSNNKPVSRVQEEPQYNPKYEQQQHQQQQQQQQQYQNRGNQQQQIPQQQQFTGDSRGSRRNDDHSQNTTPKKPMQSNNYVDENPSTTKGNQQQDYVGRRRDPSHDMKSDNTKSSSKLSTMNQVYKPTNDLLTWQEPPPTDSRPKTSNAKKSNNPIPEDTRPITPAPTTNKIAENIAKEKEEENKRKDQVKGLESNLMNLQVQRDSLNNELQRIEKNKIKNSATINRKKEIDNDLNYLNLNISNIKNKLRELNALHPF